MTRNNPIIENSYLIRLTKTDYPDASMLIKENFNCHVCCPNETVHDKLIEYLDSKNIEHLLGGDNKIIIKCNDRETEYKVSKFINGLVSKYGKGSAIMDRLKESSKSDFEKRERDARERLAAGSKRNAAGAMITKIQAQGGARPTIIPNKAKEMNKKLGRKKVTAEEGFVLGEKVLYKGQEFLINEINNSGSVSIVNKQKLITVNSNQLKKVNEGVLGMTNVPELNRYLTLAGMKPILEDELDHLEDHGNNPEGHRFEISNSVDTEDGHENDEGHYDVSSDNDEPEDRMSRTEMPMSNNTCEYKDAMCKLDEIQELIPKMKLEEFKLFIDSLNDVIQHIRTIAGEYVR